MYKFSLCGVFLDTMINASLSVNVFDDSWLYLLLSIFFRGDTYTVHIFTRLMHQKTHVREIYWIRVCHEHSHSHFTHTHRHKYNQCVLKELNLRWLKVWWKLFEKWMIDAQQCYICNVDKSFSLLSFSHSFSIFHPLNWWWWWLSWKIAATWSTQSCTFIVVFPFLWK